MDIYPQNFHELAGSKSLPENGSVYLCDSKGALLYAITKWNVSDEELQHFTDELLQGIQDGSLLAYDASFRDPEGVERGVYYYEMSSGWTVILTIPFQTVLMGERNLPVMVLVVISALVMAVMVIMVLRDLVNSRRIQRADSTIHILGDSFYAIYRVNYKTGAYEAIKLSPDMVAPCRRQEITRASSTSSAPWWSPTPSTSSPWPSPWRASASGWPPGSPTTVGTTSAALGRSTSG